MTTSKRLIRDLERELKKEPGNLVIRLQLAAAYREATKPREALELYRSVARAYAEQGRHGQAAAVCRSALEMAPEDSELYGLLMHLERILVTTAAPPAARAGAAPPNTTPGQGTPAVVAQPGASPPGGTVSRTRVLPAEVSVRELGSVAPTVKHAAPPPVTPATPPRGPVGPPISSSSPPGRSAPTNPTPTPVGRPSIMDVDTPLPPPLPLHETTGRDSLLEMAELIGRRTPQPVLRPTPRATTDDDMETVLPLTQVRSPGADVATGDLPPVPRAVPAPAPPPRRAAPATRPPPPPPPRARTAPDTRDPLTDVRTAVAESPATSDFAREMSTRKRPKLSADELALLDLAPTDMPSEDGPTEITEVGQAVSDFAAADAPVTLRHPRIAAPGDPAEDDEPTRPPGMATPGIATHAPRGATAVPPDMTLRGEQRAASRPTPTSGLTDEPSSSFDRFDVTLSALGPGGAAIEGPLGIFSMLPPEAATELFNRAVVKQFGAGEVIIREGDPGDACYVVVHGEVAVHKRAPDGHEMVELARLGDGSLFGEFALLADCRRHATVRATTECEVYEVPRLLLRELAAMFPEVGPALETFYRERLLSNLLFTTPLFALVPDDQRAPLLSRFHPLHAESGQAIVRQGERAGGLYLIVLGAVEVVRRIGDRRALVLATLGEGSYFGEMSLLSGDMASASVIAAGPCELAVLPPRDFYEVVASSPELWSAMRAEADARRLANAQILAGHTGVV